MKTIHILHHGHALCGQEGTPNQWPEEHLWVDITETVRSTCKGCRREVLRQMKVKLEKERA